MRYPSLFASLLALASATSDLLTRQSTACNNSPSLCSKPYQSIVHLGAHDSPFVRDASTGYSISGNQYYNSTIQLSAGVRMLTAQVHISNGGYHLCHSSCNLLDMGLLSDWLKGIKTWLDNNPNEVVTILLVNSDSLTPTQLAGEVTKSGITKYAYVPPSANAPPQSWPTLQQLITAGTRLMIFVAPLDLTSMNSNTAFLMDEFTFIFENPYQNMNFTAFTCTPDRPTAVKGSVTSAIGSGRMALMNHFMYEEGMFDIEITDSDSVTTTNAPGDAVGMLGQAAKQCTQVYGKVPTFILVDFFDQGPALTTIDSLNGVTNPVGRQALPARDANAATAGTRSQRTWKAVQALAAEVSAGTTPKLGDWIWAGGYWSLGGINLSGGSVLGD